MFFPHLHIVSLTSSPPPCVFPIYIPAPALPFSLLLCIYYRQAATAGNSTGGTAGGSTGTTSDRLLTLSRISLLAGPGDLIAIGERCTGVLTGVLPFNRFTQSANHVVQSLTSLSGQLNIKLANLFVQYNHYCIVLLVLDFKPP